jgi:hypothetical protein
MSILALTLEYEVQFGSAEGAAPHTFYFFIWRIFYADQHK